MQIFHYFSDMSLHFSRWAILSEIESPNMTSQHKPTTQSKTWYPNMCDRTVLVLVCTPKSHLCATGKERENRAIFHFTRPIMAIFHIFVVTHLLLSGIWIFLSVHTIKKLVYLFLKEFVEILTVNVTLLQEESANRDEEEWIHWMNLKKMYQYDIYEK